MNVEEQVSVEHLNERSQKWLGLSLTILAALLVALILALAGDGAVASARADPDCVAGPHGGTIAVSQKF